MKDEKLFEVFDKDGNKTIMQAIFIGKSESLNKEFIFYFDPKANDGQVYASLYGEDDTLHEVDENDWDEVNSMFEQYMEEHKCQGCEGKESNNCSGCDNK